MKQAQRDADYFGGMPAVFHRKNREPWLVTMKLSEWLQIYENGPQGARKPMDDNLHTNRATKLSMGARPFLVVT